MDTSPQTSTSIAQLLGAAIRYQTHRRAVTEWLPRADRMKEVKGKRGWEKSSITNINAPSRQGGWVARNLTALLRSRDSKVKVFLPIILCVTTRFFFRFQLQEAALSALAALSKDNTSVAVVLAKSSPDRDGNNPVLIHVYITTEFCIVQVPSPLSSVLSLCKSRSLDVQLAACLWYNFKFLMSVTKLIDFTLAPPI